MKAYLYEEKKDGKGYIWARFDNNSNETVTIFMKKETFINNIGNRGRFSMNTRKEVSENSL